MEGSDRRWCWTRGGETEGKDIFYFVGFFFLTKRHDQGEEKRDNLKKIYKI